MKQTMTELFGTYAHEIVFLHVLSAFVWVGGMIAIRLAVHPNLQLIEDPKVRLGRTLAITGKFFNVVIPFILLLILTAVIMAVGLGLELLLSISMEMLSLKLPCRLIILFILKRVFGCL